MTSVCKRCASEIPANALVCTRCHALIHSSELDQLAAGAKMLEEQRDFRAATEQWLKELPLLPENSTQSEWIHEHVRRLSLMTSVPVAAADKTRNWPKWLAPLAPIILFLSKGKAILALFNAKFLLSFGAFLGVYWSLFGMAFALGFVVQILIHEMGHYLDIRRRGLPADMPLFLPGVGAFVRWNALGVSLETRAAVSLAGPLAGCLAAAACAAVWTATGEPLWAALAGSGAWLNLLNMIPVLGLDGGHAVLALSRAQRASLLGLTVILFLLIGNGVLMLVALGLGWRLATADLPAQPSTFATSYFAAVVCLLSVLIWLFPGAAIERP